VASQVSNVIIHISGQNRSFPDLKCGGLRILCPLHHRQLFAEYPAALKIHSCNLDQIHLLAELPATTELHSYNLYHRWLLAMQS
jgi:hypothetical protein